MVDPEGDGSYSALMGSSTLADQRAMEVNLETGASRFHELTGIGRNGYRVTQTAVIPAGDSYRYFLLSGTHIVLLPPDFDGGKKETIAGAYAYFDLWHDRSSNRLLLAISQSGFYGSNLTQPLVMDAFGRTMKELNAFASEVVALANQPKRVRLFYSETAAINDGAYMDHVFDAYQALYHDGLPLGFVTGRILAEAAPTELVRWPVVVVAHANRVTIAERQALNRYLSSGGTLILIGAQSLGRDEYGRPHRKDLETGKGKLLRLDAAGETLSQAVRDAGLAPPLTLTETNAVGKPGCVWRAAPWQGGHLLLVINLGKSKAQLAIGDAAACRDLIAGRAASRTFALKPFGVALLHVQAGKPEN